MPALAMGTTFRERARLYEVAWRERNKKMTMKIFTRGNALGFRQRRSLGNCRSLEKREDAVKSGLFAEFPDFFAGPAAGPFRYDVRVMRGAAGWGL